MEIKSRGRTDEGEEERTGDVVGWEELRRPKKIKGRSGEVRTYNWRVVQNYGGRCHLSDEYDEDDGEELEEEEYII